MKTKYLLLVIIILFGSFIRLFKISNLPPSLYYDEVDAGYQAMVFNQNQTDYYGNKFPIHFHSFGDYRTSLHIYSIALFQKITNNPELSIRLPSAIYGIVSIFILFLITKSLIPSFLLAISPWAIHYSRIGFEASGMLLCLLLAIYFWQIFIKNNRFKYLYLTVLFLCLTPYFYSTAKFFIIIIVILFALIWRQEIFKIGFKKLILPFLFAVLLLLPMTKDTLTGKAGFRFSYISIFTLPHREQIVDTLRYQDASIDHPDQIGISTSFLSSIFHNKYQLVAQKFISNYINSFSPEFLFLKGDLNARHGFGNHGLVYIVDFVFIVFGLFITFKTKQKNKLSLFFFWLLILSPIPYSLTRDSDSPNATRLILMSPSIIYFAYLGIKYIQQKYKGSIFLIILIYGLSCFSFWHYYYYHYPQESAAVWNTGMKEVIAVTNNYPQKTLIFSDSYLSFVSHFLFYHPYTLTPNISLMNNLQKIENRSFSGQVLDDKYFFGKINWNNFELIPQNSLIIIPETEKSQIPESFKLIEKINKKYEMAQNFYIYQFDNQ
ncbi:MAG: glycosyltransferase family 39 protein [Candidatus Shapirobacteria bacterium]|nr:glycosyltransferase family 39 protein [Candidatus Shapirobacteria bacterium]